MTYETILVHVAVGHPNDNLLVVARQLSAKFEARVVGVAGCLPSPLIFMDGYAQASFVPDDLAEIDREIGIAEAEFRSAFATSSAPIEWRSAKVYGTLADYVAAQCRTADLVITGGIFLEADELGRREKPGDIVIQAGRPVIVVPAAVTTCAFDHVVVAWKNTREARRAISDAIPLMQSAGRVTVLEIAPADELAEATARLVEICAWLKTHGVSAEPRFVEHGKGDDPAQLEAAFEALGADIVVAGAYGHSRLREWALGSVTRELIRQPHRCVFLAH